jgi:hypothetical protein
MDGDTVIIELLEPFKWTEYATSNVVVGKDSLGQSKLLSSIQTKGYTHETAIETRIIDLEVIGDSGEDDTEKELKAAKKDYIRH